MRIHTLALQCQLDILRLQFETGKDKDTKTITNLRRENAHVCIILYCIDFMIIIPHFSFIFLFMYVYVVGKQYH